MLLRLLRRILTQALGTFGYELRRVRARPTVIGALLQARQAGLQVQTVLDVGAARGTFSAACRRVFPHARYLLIEPLIEYRHDHENVLRTLDQVEWVTAAASAKPGEVIIHVHPDLDGSSSLLEAEVAGVNGEPRSVPAISLDSLAAQKDLTGPFLIKVDVQGAELSVLDGAAAVLPLTEYILLEVSLFHFFEGGPVIGQVLNYMQARGFVPFDVLNLQYRPIDNALAQVDIAFAREAGPLRQHHLYATAEQRRAQWANTSS